MGSESLELMQSQKEKALRTIVLRAFYGGGGDCSAHRFLAPNDLSRHGLCAAGIFFGILEAPDSDTSSDGSDIELDPFDRRIFDVPIGRR